MCRQHSVRFYDDAYPAEEAGDFIVAGLQEGDACIVMLTLPHRQAVERHLAARGVSIHGKTPHAGLYSAIDTNEALTQLMVGGRLDTASAAASLGALLNPATHGSQGRVRLVGDPAPALFAMGNHDDTFALEALVDGLAGANNAAVFCAYPIQDFCGSGHTSALLKVSAEHSTLGFPKGLWAQGYVQAGPAPGNGALPVCTRTGPTLQ